MNKRERHRRERNKLVKRLLLRGLTLDDYKDPNNNLYALKHHSTVCSCWMCKGERYSRKVKYKLNNVEFY